MAKKPTYEELEQRVKELEKEALERQRAEQALQEKTWELAKRVKELNCLYEIGHLREEPGVSLEEMLRRSVYLIPAAWQFPEITCARLVVNGQEYKTNGFRETPWCQASEIIVHGKTGGILEVFYLEERPERDEGPFLREERDLLDAIAERLRRIIEHKGTEEALKESEDRYRHMFDEAPVGIHQLDRHGRITHINRTELKMLGYTEEQILGKYVWDLIVERDVSRKAVMSKITVVKPPGKAFERTFRRKDGTTFPAIIEDKLIKNEVGQIVGIQSTMQDISERRNLEAQLAQAQKMKALGTLAGGIAHNFNNLLMGIQGNVSIMLLDVDSPHPHYERLKSIEKGVQNGSRLTRQLLGFAREGRYEIRPISLNQVVEETSNTFGATKKEITVHQDLAKDLYGIQADQGQIEQVLLNLYVNAADAMPGGRDLFLKTMNVTQKDMRGKTYKAKPGNYVLLTVRDTGTGMDKKTMERIFDPFFTTKGLAKGTGLGLASVYGIVKAHGGYIDVESRKGHGTTFYVYLPATKAKDIVKRVAAERGAEILQGKETVLLVDDEDMIIDVGQELLKTLGYKVLIAKGGREAVDIYKTNKDTIDIVILDMIMPIIGGGEAYDRMKEINHDVKVLLSSGYSINGQAT